MGWFSGIGDIFKGAGDVVTDVAKGIGKVGQTAVDAVSKFGSGLDDSVHGTINSIPSMLASVDDLAHLAVNGTVQPIEALASGDLNDWSKSVKNSFSQFDDIGTDLFGSGSWLTGGVNYASTGNPFYGAGTTGAQLIEGDKYTKGSTTDAGNLMGLYNVGSNLASGTPTPTVDTSGGVSTNYGNVDVGSGTYSPTYAEPGLTTNTSFLGNSGTDYTGSFGASGITNSGQQGTNMNYNTNYGNLDPTYTGTQADGLGSGVDYNQGLINSDQTYLTGRSPTTFDQFTDLYNQFSSGVNSPLGKLGLSLVGQSNPRLAALARIAGAGGEGGGGFNQAAKGLADIYSTEMQRRTQRDITRQQQLASQQSNDFINNQINAVDNMYGQNSAYANQMRQELERKDAAAGRRSQYGGREVELQAKLAAQQSQMRQAALVQAPQFAKNIQTATNATQARSLGLLDMYLKNQQNINGGLQQGANYLGNLF